MIDQSYARLIIKQFEPLVYQTINSFHVSQQSSNYHDFAQELRIKLIYLAENFEGHPLKEPSDRYRFVAYAKLGLRWHLLNLFKKSSREVIFDNEITQKCYSLEIYTDNMIEDLKLADYHCYAQSLLKENEYNIYLALVDELSVQQIMSLFNLKRSTFYKIKKTIQDKLQPLYKILKENLD